MIIPFSRRLLIVIALAVIGYSVAVLVFANGTTDIGLRCAFDTEVQHVETKHFPVAYSEPGGLPQTGDQIVRVGGRQIRLWSDYLHVLANLDDETTHPRQPLADSVGLEELERQAARGFDLVRVGEGDFVRVEFRRPGEEHIQVAWALAAKPSLEIFVHSLLWLAAKLALFAVVFVALWKRPQDQSLVRFLVLCAVTIGAFMGGYHWIRIATSPVLVLVFMICAVLLPVVSLHFYIVFPRPKAFVQRRPVLSLVLLYGAPTIVLVLMVATYLAVVWAYRWQDDPEYVRAYSRLLIGEIFAALAIAPCLFLGCVVSLAHSFWISPPDSRERNQVKWILFGALLATIPIGYTIYLGVTDAERFGLGGAATPMFAASLCFTLAYGISISRYGLLDVDKVVNLAITSLGLSVAAGVSYSLLVFFGTLIVGSQIEPQSPLRQAAWMSITALLLLLALDLVRWRLRQAMDRRLHRERYQLDKTLRRMSEAAEQGVDPPVLCRQLLQALSELLNLERAAVFLREDEQGVYRLACHLGVEPPQRELPPAAPLVSALAQQPLVRLRHEQSPPVEESQRQLQMLGGEIAVALRHEGQLIAILVTGSRMLGGYGAEELQVLNNFAQLAALALRSAQGLQTIEVLNRELRSKVEKISEQQRRIVLLQSQLLRTGQSGLAEAPLRAGDADPDSVGETTAPVSTAIVGSSSVVQDLLHTVRKVAVSPSAVLIRGESGTGKELLAQALHQNSPRAGGPFVKVHCAALSPGLLESELFGHVKGAFTGAHRDKVGRFELANGGTLFLDEIGDISLDVQTKLLRVLQEMTFERVGSSEPVKIDVRIVAATNQNLERLMRDSKFREDLFYRLNVITIRTPSLRERREDIYELALHFVRKYSQRSGKTITHIEEEALEALKAYGWPGNIRELENVIERAVVLADGESIALGELPAELLQAAEAALAQGEPRRRAPVPDPRDVSGTAEPAVPQSQWEARHEGLERDRLALALAKAAGNKSKAAQALGMPRSTLTSKLEKYGLAGRRQE